MRRLKTENEKYHRNNKYGKVTFLIDDSDYERVKKHKWKFYDRYIETIIDGKTIRLSRFLLKAQSDTFVDHKNGNKLDNTRKNLRFCTRFQNQQNRKLNINNSCGYKGIQLMKNGKYRVRVQTNGVRVHLGMFSNLKDAINKRKSYAKEKHGEFYRFK